MIRGQSRPFPTMDSEKNVADMSLMGSIHNRFDIEVVDATTGKVKQTARAFNTVLDTWWKYPTNQIQAIAYGRGSGVPSRTDTDLFSKIGTVGTNATIDTSTYLKGYITATCRAQLDPSTAVGETITEVGLCKYYTSGSYGYYAPVTHAMLQDMNGNPISITKTATDIINIHGTAFLHFGVSGYRDKSMLLCGAGILAQFIGGYFYSSDVKFKVYNNADIYSDSTGENSAAAVILGTSTWDQNSKTYTMRFNRASVGTANMNGGICLLHLVSHSGLLGSTATPYMFIRPTGMSRIVGESVATADGNTTQFKTKFHFPQNAVVYVDGVAKTDGVTVVPDCGQPSTMYRYFMRLDGSSTNDCIFGTTKTKQLHTTGTAAAIYDYLFCDAVAITNLVFDRSGVTLYASTDLDNWEKIGTTGSTTASQTLPIPTKYGKYRYWKVETTDGMCLTGGQGENLNGYAIRFDEAPANGSVITIDYDTPMIPKDENNVMDMTLSFVLDEYNGV